MHLLSVSVIIAFLFLFFLTMHSLFLSFPLFFPIFTSLSIWSPDFHYFPFSLYFVCEMHLTICFNTVSSPCILSMHTSKIT